MGITIFRQHDDSGNDGNDDADDDADDDNQRLPRIMTLG